jgi:hypothetical protein
VDELVVGDIRLHEVELLQVVGLECPETGEIVRKLEVNDEPNRGGGRDSHGIGRITDEIPIAMRVWSRTRNLDLANGPLRWECSTRVDVSGMGHVLVAGVVARAAASNSTPHLAG